MIFFLQSLLHVIEYNIQFQAGCLSAQKQNQLPTSTSSKTRHPCKEVTLILLIKHNIM